MTWWDDLKISPEDRPSPAPSRRPPLGNIVFAAVSLLYPILAAVAVRQFGPKWVVFGLAVLLLSRMVLGSRRQLPLAATWGMLAVAAAVGGVALFDQTLSVRLYPVFMNAAMLAAFGATLVHGQTMIERLARLHKPDLPPSGVRYTRQVTWVWCGFFAANGLIALWTALAGDWRMWTLYNGGLAYGAMGLLFAGEWLVRRRVMGGDHGRG